MENFKLATKEQVQFKTSKGLLSTEQLWDLTFEELDKLVVSLEEELTSLGKKSYLTKQSAKDKTIKLKFDVALEVLRTKLEDAETLRLEKQNKARNEKIINIINKKTEENLESKTIAELEAMLNN